MGSYYTLLYNILYSPLQCSNVLYSTLLYCTVLYYRAKLQYKVLSQILCWHVEEALQAVEEPKTLRFSSIIFCARYIHPIRILGGERSLAVGRWTCNPEDPGWNLPPCRLLDLSCGPELNSSMLCTPCK